MQENDNAVSKSAELGAAQREDPTLEGARKVAEGARDLPSREGFYFQNNLLYHRWKPKGGGEAVEHLVLPAKCRDIVMAISHEIPLGGYLGKTKTSQRLLQRFYWPTVYHDVANYCQSWVHGS